MEKYVQAAGLKRQITSLQREADRLAEELAFVTETLQGKSVRLEDLRMNLRHVEYETKRLIDSGEWLQSESFLTVVHNMWTLYWKPSIVGGVKYVFTKLNGMKNQQSVE